MSTTNSNRRNNLTFIFITTALCLGTGLSFQNLLFARQPVPQATPVAPVLGEFKLRRFGRFEYVSSTKDAVSTFIITQADLTSPRYDFAANNVRLNIKKGKAQTGTATGKVHITARDQVYVVATKKFVSTQTIAVDCDRAKYVAGDAKLKINGRIDFSGNIVSKTTRPDFAVPLVLTGETGYIEFLGASKTNLVINNGSATVTPIEPTPAPGPKKQ